MARKPTPPTTLHASAAETATGNSGARAAVGTALAVSINVSAVTGTGPSLALSVEWSPDGVTFGAGDPADTFTVITATTTVSKVFNVKAPFYRLVWTITGTTPSFTFLAVSIQT